jgi:CheY-like chemotaxis protein
MNISRSTKIFSNFNNNCSSIVLIVIIVFFEVVPEGNIWSVPIEPEDLAVPGLAGSLLLIQKQDADVKQCCQRRRILIIDDELYITFTFKMILEENGFNKQVDTYNEPLLALQNFKPGVYGLLIIDIVMPVMDGFRLYQQIKQIDNKPKVIFATAYYLNYDVSRGYFPIKDENNEIDKILGDNGGRFLKKPVNNNELVARVKSELLS